MLTDSRARGHIARCGQESWGLNALEPRVLDELVSHAIERRMDPALYDETIVEEASDRGWIQLSAASVRGGEGQQAW